jgi:hypothetical protein
MTNPITPPPGLVQQWAAEARLETLATQHICNQAAQWGADQELDACAEWVGSMFHGHKTWADELRNDRRPKPPTLKEQALAALHGIHDQGPTPEQVTIIRRALEQLDG